MIRNYNPINTVFSVSLCVISMSFHNCQLSIVQNIIISIQIRLWLTIVRIYKLYLLTY